MTEQPLPKFPATPEEIKAASEKAMNFWVGALSPMWVPFWAASSFGLGAWAISQNMSKKMGDGLVTPDSLLKDLPSFGSVAGKWPGFTGIWGAYGAAVEPGETKAKPQPVHSPVPMPEMFTGVSAAMAAALSPAEVEPAAKVAEVPEPATALPETPEVAAPKPATPPKPNLSKPAKAKTVKPTVAKVEPITVTPKPIAKTLSAAKPAKPKA